MRIEDVAKLPPLERFIYWIRERYELGMRRAAGQPKPWTDDEVMQRVFFTWPYREMDKTTVWFRENVRDPLHNDPAVLMATVIFRWFNRISTGKLLLDAGLLIKWNERRAVKLLKSVQGPVFTGAYMIKCGNGPPGSKVSMVCSAITEVWKHRRMLAHICKKDCRLQALWQDLKKFNGLGGFMSYEIVCDLRYTYLLEVATDPNTWSNPGPGAMRGLLRLQGFAPGLNKRGRVKRFVTVDNPLPKMRNLLGVIRSELSDLPALELREVEHSLCEWDKYERARLNDGKLKRKYDGCI